MKKILLGLILLSTNHYAQGAQDPYRTPPRPVGRQLQVPGAPQRLNEGGLPPIYGGFGFRRLNFEGAVAAVPPAGGATPPGGEPN